MAGSLRPSRQEVIEHDPPTYSDVQGIDAAGCSPGRCTLSIGIGYPIAGGVAAVVVAVKAHVLLDVDESVAGALDHGAEAVPLVAEHEDRWYTTPVVAAAIVASPPPPATRN